MPQTRTDDKSLVLIQITVWINEFFYHGAQKAVIMTLGGCMHSSSAPVVK